MKTLQFPRFKELAQGECAGAPILRRLWDIFDFSLLMTQSGIYKDRGVPTWILAFVYVLGLIAQKSSVVQKAKMAAKDALLGPMFGEHSIKQYTLSRFFTANYDWTGFGRKRVERLQREEQTCLKEGDQINLDDTLLAHPYAKQLPFLSWLFDHARKTYVWGMNLVVLQAVLTSGLEYPLSYAVWHKPKDGEPEKTKFDLARELLLQLRKTVSCRLWIAMDRWYLCKDFFVFLMEHQFDWVTKAKRNTALYRQEIEPLTGRVRYVPVRPIHLIREVFHQLVKSSSPGLTSVSIPNIYMKLPCWKESKRGPKRLVKKQCFVAIAAVVAMRLNEDEEQPDVTETDPEAVALYRGAYLIISNRADAPKDALMAYVKRWRIEVFFRTAKQELSMQQCHSTTEIHHHAHLELLLAAETLLSYALWQQNKEKTSDDEGYTHGEMVRGLFHTRCQVRVNNQKGVQRIFIDFDTEVQGFARLIRLFWPDEIRMLWVPKDNYQCIPTTA